MSFLEDHYQRSPFYRHVSFSEHNEIINWNPMVVRSAYENLDSWVKGLPTGQYALLCWVLAFVTSLLISDQASKDNLRHAIITATGAAGGSMIGRYLRKVHQHRYCRFDSLTINENHAVDFT